MFLCMATIFYCQIVLCYETRRHKKEIAAQKVSLEAREKFLKEKKAFKLTTTVLFFLILCYLALILARTLISKSVIKSVNLAYIALFAGIIVAIFNSIVNPIIYCVRIRQFRVAFIQLVFTRRVLRNRKELHRFSTGVLDVEFKLIVLEEQSMVVIF